MLFDGVIASNKSWQIFTNYSMLTWIIILKMLKKLMFTSSLQCSSYDQWFRAFERSSSAKVLTVRSVNLMPKLIQTTSGNRLSIFMRKSFGTQHTFWYRTIAGLRKISSTNNFKIQVLHIVPILVTWHDNFKLNNKCKFQWTRSLAQNSRFRKNPTLL